MKLTKSKLKEIILKEMVGESKPTESQIKWKYLLWAITQTTKNIPRTIKHLNLDVTDSSEVDPAAEMREGGWRGSLSERIEEYLETLETLERQKEELRKAYARMNQNLFGK